MPTVLYERRGRIAYVTLNRPKDMNAINEEMHKLLWEVWQEFAAEEMATRILPNEQWRCARPRRPFLTLSAAKLAYEAYTGYSGAANPPVVELLKNFADKTDKGRAGRNKTEL